MGLAAVLRSPLNASPSKVQLLVALSSASSALQELPHPLKPSCVCPACPAQNLTLTGLSASHARRASTTRRRVVPANSVRRSPPHAVTRKNSRSLHATRPKRKLNQLQPRIALWTVSFMLPSRARSTEQIILVRANFAAMIAILATLTYALGRN